MYVYFTSATSYLRILPNRENIISRSSSVVTGLSLQTNSTLSSGFISASGRSPTCSGHPAISAMVTVNNTSELFTD